MLSVKLQIHYTLLFRYPIALSMVASGAAKVKQLITHNFSLEDTIEAFEVAKTGVGNPIKVMIHPLKERA